jgi:REP element-mobilizing transposase RayT
MDTPEPIYTAANCQAAYQLNWAVSFFPRSFIPAAESWFAELERVTEKDGVRILNHRCNPNRAVQFLVSTRPETAPADIVRSLKGRLQYILRDVLPKAFRRNYRIESVGSASRSAIEGYVSKQPERHPMADPRVQELFESVQIDHPEVDLSRIRYSAHGQFIHNLHVVLEYAAGWQAVDAEVLRATSDMIESVCADRGFLLSRAGIVVDHLHMTLGCGIDDAPMSVALAFLNSLASVDEMRPFYKFGFFAGTFGNYDLGAIRNASDS